MISHKHKCIFIHIPKTGGSTIEKIFHPQKKDRNERNLYGQHANSPLEGGLQHLTSTKIIERVGSELFEDYFTFSFVRNPWDKMVSQYSYLNHMPGMREKIGIGPDTNFKEYLKVVDKTDRKHAQLQPQSHFITDDDGKINVDFIGRFENFEGDLRLLLKRFALGRSFFGLFNRKIPKVNASRRKNTGIYYDDESRELVARIYKKDIELFNYQFPGL